MRKEECNMISNDYVVAVGLGTINSLGHSVDEVWSGLLTEKVGVGPITSFDTSPYNSHHGYEVKGIPDRERTPSNLLSMAVAEAIIHAFGLGGLDNISPDTIPPMRRGAYVGTCLTGTRGVEEAVNILYSKGPLRVGPKKMPPMLLSYLSGHLTREFGLNGPTGAIDTACTSGLDAIVFCAHKLLSGEADIMIACGVDVFSEILLASLNRAQVVSQKDWGCRPFDRYRDGLGPGEGAAAIVMMNEKLAQELGINPLARLAGWSLSNDAYHVTAPLPEGEVAAQTMLNALAMAGIDPWLVDYLNAHGTGTILNDIAETKAIKRAFTDLAYHLAVGSTKGATGHLLGAAGVLEALICILAITKDTIPPTTNLKQRDLQGGCDLNYVRRVIKKPVRVAVSNSFGFGGHNGTVVFAAT